MAQNLEKDISSTENAKSVLNMLATCPSVADDLEDIYTNTFLADVNFKTKTNSFPAHKIVLCARSPVFKLMFSNDMREKNSDTIQVDDLEDGTIQQLLLFLYSDKIEVLEWEKALKLYYAADKYQILKLKLICSSFLIDNLTASTAPEILVLADIHNDSGLMEVVQDFILGNDEEVFGSKKWEELIETNTQLAARMMHLRYKAKKKQLPDSGNSREHEGASKCFLCNRRFPTNQLYRKHLLHVHMEWVEKKGSNHNDGKCRRDAIDTFICEKYVTNEEFLQIFFSSKKSYNYGMCNDMISSYHLYCQHMQRFEAEKCFRCVISSCLKTFTSPSMFEKHIQEHIRRKKRGNYEHYEVSDWAAEPCRVSADDWAAGPFSEYVNDWASEPIPVYANDLAADHYSDSDNDWAADPYSESNVDWSVKPSAWNT